MTLKAEHIQAEHRPFKGKGPSRELRRNKRVPIVIYGSKKENVDLSIKAYDISLHALKPGFMTKIFKFDAGKDNYLAIPHKIQYHPVTDSIEHIDFLHVIEGQEVKVHLKLHYLNADKCPGVKRGAVLNTISRSIDVYCSPSNIPSHIDVDVSELDIGTSLHINDVKLPEGVRFAGNDNITMATIVGRAKDEEVAAPAAEAAPAKDTKKSSGK